MTKAGLLGGVACVITATVSLGAADLLADTGPRLRVFAAASATDLLQEVAKRYEHAHIAPSFGGSSVLARQIRDGAPADVFVSADRAWIDFLRDAGAIDGEPIVLARNRLVCIGAATDRLAHRGVTDPRTLLDAIGADGRVAIANEGVPAGEYTRAALAHLNLLDAFRPHLVGQRDVRAVLHAVERGELAAGFVYATDAQVAAVEPLFAFAATSHPPIEYQAAVIRSTRNADAARRFLDHLQSEPTRALLTSAGFALPPSP